MELLDAVKAAISGESTNNGGTTDESIASAAPSGADDTNSGADDSAATGSVEGSPEGGDAPAGADAAGGDAGEPAAKVEGAGDDSGTPAGEATPRARDAQGRFVKADGSVDADQAPKKGEPGYVEPAAKPAAKAPDPINDPPPAGLSQKAQERFTTLVKTAKEVTARAEQAESDRDLLVRQVEATGATPEQYVETLSILRDINSGNPQAEERAYDYLLKATAALGERLGKVAPGTDPLTGHQDLIQDVIEGRITRARAEELAGARRTTQAQTVRTTAQQQTEQQRTEQQNAVTAGTQALNALEGRLKAADPVMFAAKRATVIRAAKPVLAKLPPAQWATTFESMYNAMPAPAPAPTPRPGTPAAGARPANQPLRGKPSAGAQKAAPKSNEDAVRQALGM